MTDKELREQAEKVYRQLWERDVFQGFPHDQDVATIAAALEEAWAKVDIAKRWTRQERGRADRAEAERDELAARVKAIKELLRHDGHETQGRPHHMICDYCAWMEATP